MIRKRRGLGTPRNSGTQAAATLADGSADPENVSWNLLVEAEHGENSTAVLVTHARDLVGPVVEAVTRFSKQLSPQRRAYAETVFSERGGVVITANLEQSFEFANRFAAEHAALMVAVMSFGRKLLPFLASWFP